MQKNQSENLKVFTPFGRSRHVCECSVKTEITESSVCVGIWIRSTSFRIGANGGLL